MNELAWMDWAAGVVVSLSLLVGVWVHLRYRCHLAELQHRLTATDAAQVALEQRAVESDLRVAALSQAVQDLQLAQKAHGSAPARVDDRAARIEEMHRVLDRAQAASAARAADQDEPPMRWLDTEPAGLTPAYAATMPVELAVEERKLPPLRKPGRMG